MVGSFFRIRSFRPNDLDRVMHINQICLPENYSAFFFTELYERFPETFIVAEEKEVVVGYGMCRIETKLPDFGLLGIPKRGHLISIAVLPENQREGIGTALIEKILGGLRFYKAKECFLEVRVNNTPAVNLYKKFGFKTNKIAEGYYSDGEDAYVMSAKL